MTILLDILPPVPTGLQVLWFILIAVLWIGFFFLEGFDFGVGMLIPFLGKNDQGRRVVMNTIGPHWDGNEVWLLTAGGAMFAAFPGWYSTLFSGLYIPLFLVLLGLIVRGVSFEFRSKRESATWRTTWDWLACIGAFIPAIVFGVGFANFVIGMPLKSVTTEFGTVVPLFSGSFLGLFSPFALIGGLLFVALFLTHGAHFVSLKTSGEIHDRAQIYASRLGIVSVVLLVVFVVWGNARWGFGILPAFPRHPDWLTVIGWIVGIVSILALGFSWWMNSKHRDGWAFVGTGVSVVMLVVMLFASFYPGLGFNNSTVADTQLNVITAASSPLTLKLMTIFACIMVPIVLAYTAWSYWVFRRRLNVTSIPPLDVTTAA